MKSMIPMRADSPVRLSESEKDCIAWCVLSGCSRNEAFAIFCRPELKDSRIVLEKVSAQFFGSADVISYMESYRSTVNKALTSQNTEKVFSADEMKSRKERAMQKLMNYVIEQSNNIDNVENKEDIIKFADKLGLLGSEEEVAETPRRYLPETCSRCRYKAFVEANCTEEEE